MGDASLGGAVGEPIVVRYPDNAAHGVVEEIIPDRRIFSWAYDDARYGMAAEAHASPIDLTPIASGTLVTLRHSGIPTDAVRREHRMGWRHFVSTLGDAALLERCWATDAIFRDAMGYAEGRGDFSDYIGAAQRYASKITFERVGGLLHAHGFVQYRWRMLAPDHSVIAAARTSVSRPPTDCFSV